MRLAVSSLKLFVARFGNSVLTLVGLAYFAQEMTQAALGTFFLYQSILHLLSIPASVGQGGALIKRLSEDRERERFLGSAAALMLVSVILTGAVVLAFRSFVNGYFGRSLAVWLVLGLVLLRLQRLGVGCLEGELRVGETADIAFLQKAIWIGGGAILINFDSSVEALISSFLLGIMVTSVVAFIRTTTSLGLPSLHHTRSLVRYWKWSSVSFVDGYLYNWADVTLLGYFVGPSVVAAYEIAWRLGNFAMILTKSVETTLLPQISNLDAEQRFHDIRGQISHGLFLSFLLVLPITAGAFAIGEPLLTIVFGQGYAIAALPLLVLLIGKQVEVVDSMYKNLLSGVDKPRFRAIAAVVSGVGNVGLNVLLIPLFGAVGAALATSLAFALSTVIILYYASMEIELVFPVKQIGTLALSALVMSGSVYALTTVLPVQSIYILGGMIVAGATIYFLQCLLYPPSRGQLVRLADDLIPRINPTS